MPKRSAHYKRGAIAYELFRTDADANPFIIGSKAARDWEKGRKAKAIVLRRPPRRKRPQHLRLKVE